MIYDHIIMNDELLKREKSFNSSLNMTITP